MNVEYLHEFIVVARRLNFREAADQLCLSPSALSKHVGSLETYFGTKLFTRDTHSVSLTESGVFLLDCAEVIWSMVEQSKTAIKERFSSQNVIRMSGVLDNTGYYPVVAQAEKLMRHDNPDVSVRVETSKSISLESLVDLLASDAVDCVSTYDAAERPTPYPDVVAAHICRNPLEVTIPVDHRLAQHTSISPADLEDGQFVHLVGPRYSSTWRRIDARLQKKGIAFKVKPIVAATPYDAIANTNALDDALFITPRRATPTLVLRNPNLVTLPIDFPDLSLDLDLLYLADAQTPQILQLVEALRITFKEFYPETV